MLLLLVYIAIAVGVSFLCSIAEAVLLSLTNAQVRMLEQQGRRSGVLLQQLKADVSRPLAAVLSLNTIAHTIGAAGAGAQATKVFGSGSLGIVSAVLTLLVLVLSEILPKTLGTHYARQLAPATAYMLKYMVLLLKPFVWLSDILTRRLKVDHVMDGFSRQELSAMADLGFERGALQPQEVEILKNLLLLREMNVRQIMTPRTVLFSLPESTCVGEFYHRHQQQPFSRIPLYSGERDNITGYVIKTDLLLAQARGNSETSLANYRRPLPAFIDTFNLFELFHELAATRTHIMMVVDEYGSVDGIVTLEDIVETLLGLEIVDEKDRATDMQKEATKLLRRKARRQGVDLDSSA